MICSGAFYFWSSSMPGFELVCVLCFFIMLLDVASAGCVCVSVTSVG